MIAYRDMVAGYVIGSIFSIVVFTLGFYAK